MKTLIPVIAVILALLAGCAGTRSVPPAVTSSPKVPDARKIAELSRAIAALDDRVDAGEALHAADVAVRYPLQLAEEYELTTPPLWHNTLVNLGIKPRGLCIHWTRDLYVRLLELDMRTLQLHWGVANSEALFRIEHSTVIITARGDLMESGIVLDPWRNSGKLFWASVGEDSYEWTPLAEVQARRAKKRAQAPGLTAIR